MAQEEKNKSLLEAALEGLESSDILETAEEVEEATEVTGVDETKVYKVWEEDEEDQDADDDDGVDVDVNIDGDVDDVEVDADDAEEDMEDEAEDEAEKEDDMDEMEKHSEEDEDDMDEMEKHSEEDEEDEDDMEEGSYDEDEDDIEEDEEDDMEEDEDEEESDDMEEAEMGDSEEEDGIEGSEDPDADVDDAINQIKKTITAAAVKRANDEINAAYNEDTMKEDIEALCAEDDSLSDASGYGIKLPAGPPSSAIVAKSDKVRIHARQDIKIVTGGPSETVNSQGEPILVKGGIHLISQNEKGKQQPIPLGNNLESCLDEVLDILGTITTSLKRFATEQMAYNDAISRHWHFSTPGVPTTFDPVLGPQGVKTVVHQFGYVVLQCDKAASNLEYIRAEYLSPGGNPGDDDNYINSPYNTTN